MNSTTDKFDIINQEQHEETEKHGIYARMNQIIIFLRKVKEKKR